MITESWLPRSGQLPSVIIQSSSAPAIKMDGSAGILLCVGCSQSNLIDGYVPDNFVSVSIKCFSCGFVTTTPRLPPGEIFPERIVSLGANTEYLASPTLVMSKEVVITCDDELEREQVRTRPRKPLDEKLSLDMVLVGEVENTFARLIGSQHFARQQRYFLHARRVKNEGAWEFPLAWGCLTLRERLSPSSGNIVFDEPFIAATTYLMMFRHFVATWGHHPGFDEIAGSFATKGQFHHNIAQFAVASYVFEGGHRINLVNAKGNGERTADLYTRMLPYKKLHIEVKTPRALQWPNQPPDAQSMENILSNALKEAKGQISREKPGIVVIGSSILQPSFQHDLHAGLIEVARLRGRGNRGVAAMIAITPTLDAERFGLGKTPGFAFDPVPNPDFEGENPVRIGKKPTRS